jgi:protein tyrosine phosphatase (PTP) superfamily phosphohydrolase (DUF442 family)
LRYSIGTLAVFAALLAGGVCAAENDSVVKPVLDDRLENAFVITDKIISGGSPANDTAFAALKSLGIKTIISVDGMKPDVKRAEAHGMRYVHLPIGYDGVPDERGLEIAKGLRDLEGPVYIHCHHGKHRAPAAALTACVQLGFLKSADAVGALKRIGTSEHYTGLYASAAEAAIVEPARIDAVKSDFPAVAKIAPLTESMTEIDLIWDRITAAKKADWATPKQHPDVVPAHEALMLNEHFRELGRAEKAAGNRKPFRKMLDESESEAAELENAIRKRKIEKASAAYLKIERSCKSCHAEYRDKPQD